MDKSLQPDGMCQLSKADDNITRVEHESVMLYFRPETEEFICIPDEDAGEFDNHCQDLARRMDEFHQAKIAHTSEVNHYTEQLVEPDANPDTLVTAVNTQEAKLEEKRQALLEILNDGDTSNMGYKEVVELIPILDTRKGKGKKQTGKRYAYSTTRYFSERSGGRSQEGKAKKWHTVTMKQASGAKESIYSVDKNGKRSIDIKKLKKQLGTDMLPKLKAELKDYVNLDDYNVDSTLFDWAESWNKAASAYKKLDCGIELSGAAQFMRFVSNAGASAEFDPNSGMLKAEAKYSEKLSLVSGIGVTECHIPDKLGWALTYKGEEGAGTSPDAQLSLDMGMIRIWLYNQITGFLGASTQLEAQLQMVVIDEKIQVLAGQSGGRLPPFKARYKGQNKPFYDQIKSEEQAASASVEAFVGVKVENLTMGTLQWLKPTPPQHSGDLPKIAGEFSDLATIGAELGAMAGFGAGTHFRCGFISGKFCFHVSASLCCGSGGKGGFICEVDARGLQELGTWLATMLFNGGYRYLKLIEKDAFTAFTQLSVLLLGLPDKAIEKLYTELTEMEDSLIALGKKFTAFVNFIIADAAKGFAASAKRNQLAEDILAAPEKLLVFTPESKGILLWLLTRHDTWDHLDFDNRDGLLWLDIYSRRKDAIVAVLHSIQSQREWMKVMSHCDSKGSDISVRDGITEEVAMKQQEEHLARFLREGNDISDKMRNKMAALNASNRPSIIPLGVQITAAIIPEIYRRLKSEQELSVGYALSMNNSYWYNLCRAANPLFPLRCDFTETDTTPAKNFKDKP